MRRVGAPQTRGLVTFVHSVRFRLTLWFVLILAIVLAAFSGLIYWSQARSLQSDLSRRLDEQSVQARAALAELELEHEVDSSRSTAALSAEWLSGEEVLILADAGGAVVGTWGRAIDRPQEIVQGLLADGSAADDRMVLRNLGLGAPGAQPLKREFAFTASIIEHDGQVAGYVIFGRESDLSQQLGRLAVSLAIGSVLMLAIAFLGGLWLADRAMRPVAAITQAARSIGETDLGRRLNLAGRDELADLAATFDGMLARLQAAFDRQRRFVADSSHELRTPLTIINLEAGRALENERTPAEYRGSLQVIATEGRRMGRLVNDLMMLARMDAGQAVLEFRTLDLGLVAAETLERLQPLAQAHKVRLIAASMPRIMVLGDRQYLLQMITNLVENGIKYSGVGAEVRVQADIESGRAFLRVSDTGPGIAPEHLPLLFDRFYQVDAARSHNEDKSASPQGSGLGLSIARSIVEAHHGEIHVRSLLQQGTTFEVVLPLQEQHLRAARD